MHSPRPDRAQPVPTEHGTAVTESDDGCAPSAGTTAVHRPNPADAG